MSIAPATEPATLLDAVAIAQKLIEFRAALTSSSVMFDYDRLCEVYLQHLLDHLSRSDVVDRAAGLIFGHGGPLDDTPRLDK